MKTLRIVTANPVYGYKGSLFQRVDPTTGAVLDHEIEDDALADELLATEDSPFREIDADGNVIPNESDQYAAAADAESEAARTVLTDTAKAAMAAEQAPAETKPTKKTIKLEAKAPAADAAPDADAGDSSTDGAVQV